MIRTFLILGVIMSGLKVLASPIETKLLKKAASQKTFYFGAGDLDGIKENELGVVYKQIHDESFSGLRVLPVARGRVIKTFKHLSIWIMDEVEEKDLLIEGDSFLVFTEDLVLKGRKKLESKSSKIVDEPEKAMEALALAEHFQVKKLAQKENIYNERRDVHQESSWDETDIDLIEADAYQTRGEVKKVHTYYRSPHKEEFLRKQRMETFQKTVNAYLVKVNDPNFNYHDFYLEQAKDPTSNEVRLRSTGMYQSYQDELLTSDEENTNLARSVEKEGLAWSENYSDDELGSVLKKISVSNEIKRREEIFTRNFKRQFYLSFGMGLADNETRDDSANSRGRGYDVEFGLEHFPFQKHDQWDRLTFETSFRLNRASSEISGANAYINEYSLAGSMYWYFDRKPKVTSQLVWFVGANIRTGIANAYAPIDQSNASYSVLGFPGLRVGAKYLLPQGYGLRLILSMESLYLEKFGTTEDSALASRTNFIDAKLGIGFNYVY